STASQTAWALIGLMAAGESGHPAVARGVEYLTSTQGSDGFWDEPRYTATGFPRVFYLRYHGYSKFFPLWALARDRNLRGANRPAVAWGRRRGWGVGTGVCGRCGACREIWNGGGARRQLCGLERQRSGSLAQSARAA